MEGGGGADNEGSGWLEVKRRNRTSSKSSVCNALKASPTKSNPLVRHNPTLVSEKVEHTSVRQQNLSPKAVPTVSSTSQVCGVSSNVTVEQEDKDVKYLGIQVVKQDVEHSLEPKFLKGGNESALEVNLNQKLDKVPKIKWGDFEDVALTLHECSGNSSRCRTIISDNDSLKAGGLAFSAESKMEFSSRASVLERKENVSSAEEQIPGKVSSSLIGKTFQENWKEVNEVVPVHVQVDNRSKECQTVVCKETLGECDLPSITEATNDLICTDKTEEYPNLPAHEIDQMMSPQSNNKPVDESVNIREIPDINSQRCSSTRSPATLEEQKLGSEALPENSMVACMGEEKLFQHCRDEGTDHTEGELGESKERFRQRLWCFLFENLNRAVDELYLLCELECDMEQIEEAVLVLKESALDFNELKSRVERFDNTIKASSQAATDEMLVNVKGYRRPHALSWEVRRMTTSPHRAEILSSSLEAFERIQLERDEKRASHAAEILNLEQHMSTRPEDKNEEAGNDKNSPDMLFKKPSVEVCKSTGNNPVKACDVASESFVPFESNILEVGGRKNIGTNVTSRKEGLLEPPCQIDKEVNKRDKVVRENRSETHPKPGLLKRQSETFDKEKERRTSATWKSMDAWKEKRNWEDILKSPMRSSRFSQSLSAGRKHTERARNLHDKLMSPEKKRKTALDMKREAEEKHARAMRIRSQLESERVQRLQRTSEKLNRVNEWQAGRSTKLREDMYARQQRRESRHEAHLAQVAKRAGDESSKVNEVRFITSLNEENKKLILRQKLHDSEQRRAEKLQVIRTKQKEDTAKEEAVLERRKLLETEKLQRLAEIQKKKEEAQLRREVERKASNAAREAKAVEQLRRKEDRAKAQQEEAELLAQKLAEKLRESEQRRKFYLEQIRERASMDFRDQSSPLLRRSINKDSQSRSTPAGGVDDYQVSCGPAAAHGAPLRSGITQHSLKRRIKKIRQRLMALKQEFIEPPIVSESTGFGCRASVGAAKMKIGRWIQDLQRFRQARKEGFTSIGLITGDIIKFLEGKELELHACRQAGLIDFIASSLPASHTSRPDPCRITTYLLRLLRVVLSLPANQSYFLSNNLLPPMIPMLSAYLENYIKVAASSSLPGNNVLSDKISVETLESVAEILEGFLWIVTVTIGHVKFEERNQKMRDGLVELVVAYRVIHHLRDLFALYDRPQVEGCPFPSAIILSLKLLDVLTSISESNSLINWEFLLARPSSYTQGTSILRNSEHSDVHCSYGSNGAAKDSELLTNPLESEGNAESLNSSQQNHLHQDCEKASFPVTKISVSSETVIKGETKSNSLDREKKSGDNGKGVSNCKPAGVTHENMKEATMKQPIAFLISAIAETGLVSLPSLLTAVLLQANNRLSSGQNSYTLPSNFEEVATGVLKILNNIAFLNISFLQNMLSRTDLKMEFFHLMSFLLSHCSSKWGAANDQIGFLLLESLLLLGYFALLHPGNQAVLRWGKSPTILHKICDLPFVFFSDPELTPTLAGTIVSSCYGCEQNRSVVLQEVSVEMLLSLLKSCRQALIYTPSNSLQPNITVSDSLLRSSIKNGKTMPTKNVLCSNLKAKRSRVQRDCRAMKDYSELALKQNAPEASTFTLHGRLPHAFLEKAELFFSAQSESVPT